MKQRYKRQNRGVQLLWLPLIAALTLGTVSMAAAETTLERIRASGKVKVGIANINPYGYVDGEGRVTGQSAELLRAFFAEQNVEVTPVVTEFGALIGGLRAGHFDIVSTGMLIQHDRCSVVAFGNPEYRSDNAFAVKQGNPLGLTSYQSVMESPVARFGMISGSGEIALAANANIPKDRQVLFPDLATAMAGLQADRVDAVVASTITINNAITRAANPAIEYAGLTEQPKTKSGTPATRYGAMAFRQDDTDLREAWNSWLAQNLANGTVTKITEPFGFGPETIPPSSLTADDVCNQ